MTSADPIDFQQIALSDRDPQSAVNLIIRQAAALRASDLFFLCDEGSLRIAVRHMGNIETLAVVSRDQGRHLINYIKASAGLDIAERRRPLEGRWINDIDDGRIDLRINIIPTIFGEDLTARVLDRKFGLRALTDLGLTRTDFNKLSGMLASPSGLILVTGPTGTGKTTTLYACVQHLNNGRRKINTLEDPIEYALPGIRQSQVNARLGVDFAELLRNILRQAPDVIMIGEIRDEETAATAVRAANSGHLVLATLHAPVAAGAVQSLRALGAHPFFLSSCLRGVIAQRLVRQLCQSCRVAYDMSESPETFSEIADLLEPGLGSFIYGPNGCEQCRHTGFTNRVGVFELMVFNRDLKQLIISGASSEELQRRAIEHGMIEFHRAALLKVAQGITSTEEVLSELPAEYLGLD
jgi:type II secretory ATPase GspE/PulE/Tfp pilus assembly ATPase PilB-like protein